MLITITDCETTKDNMVADFGAVTADLSTGESEILDEIGTLVYGQFDRKDLFFNPRADADDFWSKQNARARRKDYERRIEAGQRSIAAPALINFWLAKNLARYPELAITAYNSSFDFPKFDKTGINISGFRRRFCLFRDKAKPFLELYAPFQEWARDTGALTAKGNVSYTADNVARFILGDNLDPEPHTALEDARDYELPIAQWLFNMGAL